MDIASAMSDRTAAKSTRIARNVEVHHKNTILDGFSGSSLQRLATRIKQNRAQV